MAITAKSVLLTDANGINISPVTNLESLYIETLEKIGKEYDANVTYRKYIYQNWPIHVDFSGEPSIHWSSIEADTNIAYSFTKPVIGRNDEDIIVSAIESSTGYMGTNYNAISYYNVNLSEILQSYMPVNYANYKFNKINIDGSTNIKERFDNIYNYMLGKFNDLNNSICSTNEDVSALSDILGIKKFESNTEAKSAINSSSLIAGALYDIPYGTIDSSNANDKRVYFTVIADSSSSFNQHVINVRAVNESSGYFHTDLSKMEVIYDVMTDTVRYMKDSNNNEADFDFKYLNSNDGINSDSGIWLSIYDHSKYYELTELLRYPRTLIDIKNNKFTKGNMINIYSLHYSSPASININNNIFENSVINLQIQSKSNSININNNVVSNAIVICSSSLSVLSSQGNIIFTFNNNIIKTSNVYMLLPSLATNLLSITNSIIINNNPDKRISFIASNDTSKPSIAVDNVYILNNSESVIFGSTTADIIRENIVIQGCSSEVKNLDSSVYYTEQAMYASKFIEN